MPAAKKSDPRASLNLLGHLEELRSRILLAGGGVLVLSLACLGLAPDLIAWLKWPARGLLEHWVLIKPTEIISVYFKLALYGGIVLAGPWIVYQAWAFVKPAVPPEEDIRWPWWIAGAGLLFVLGTAFAYWVLLPAALRFLIQWSRSAAELMLTLNAYISFALAVLILGGGLFELPLALAVLTRLHLISPQQLRKKRKEALFILLVAAAVLTPTTDVFNLLLFALPMGALYEAGIWFSVWVEAAARRRASWKGVYDRET